MSSEPIDILVFTPLPEELGALTGQLPKADDEGVEHFGFRVWRHIPFRDRSDGTLVAVMPPDMDQLPAASTIYQALQRWKPRYVAGVGIAGALGNDVALGDVLVARYVFQWDAKRKEVDGPQSRWTRWWPWSSQRRQHELMTKLALVPHPVSDEGVSAANLLLADRQAYRAWQDECLAKSPHPKDHQRSPKLHIDDLASGSAVIDSLSYRNLIASANRKLRMVETETAAVLSAVRSSDPNIVTVMIRGASDAAAGKANTDALGGGVWREYAAANAFRLLLWLIRHYLVGSQPRVAAPTPKRSSRPIAMMPALPEQWVNRPAAINPIVAELHSDTAGTAGILAISALHGLGGIGKTTLARAVCYDPRVQARFPDGVLWAELGRKPDLLSVFTRWLGALGDSSTRPVSLDEASDRLRTYLIGRQMLIVLDDIWHTSDARPFLIHHAGRLLITTRRAAIADELGASLHELSLMSINESSNLLERWLGRPIQQEERPEATLLIEAVGRLPLALSLAGALIRRGRAWADAREAFHRETRRIADSKPSLPDKLAKVYAVIGVSLDALRQTSPRGWERLANLGILAQGSTLGPSLCSYLWGTSQVDARSTLDTLADEALLQREGGAYKMHLFVHDLATQTLATEVLAPRGQQLAEAHGQFLSACGWTSQLGPSSRIVDEEYVHGNLVWHLEHADQGAQIHALLARTNQEGQNYWYVNLSQRGLLANFIRDLAIGSRLAAREPQPFGLLCRYALSRSSQHPRYMSPAVLVQLVVSHHWKVARGLASAHQLSTPENKADALARLAEVLTDLDVREYGNQAAADCLTLLRSLKRYPELSCECAMRIVRSTNGEIRQSALQVLLGELQRVSLKFAVQTIFQLPADAQGASFGAVLNHCKNSDELVAFGRAFGRVAPFLSKGPRVHCVAAFARLMDSRIVMSGSSAAEQNKLIPTFGLLVDAVDDALPSDVVHIFERREQADNVKAVLLLHREGRFFETYLHRLKSLEPSERASTLCHMRGILPHELMDTAALIGKEAIQKLVSSREWVDATMVLNDLSWLLSREMRQALAQEILNDLPAQADEAGWMHARLAEEQEPAARDEIVRRAITRFTSAPRGRSADRAMAHLLLVASPQELPVLLEHYQLIGDTDEQIALRFALAPYLGAESIVDLTTLDANRRVRMFARVLQTVIGAATPQQLQDLIEAACQLVGEWWVVEELSEIVTQITDPGAIEQVMRATGAMEHGDLQSRLVSRIVTRLAETGHVERAMAASPQIVLKEERARGLCDAALRMAQLAHFPDAKRMAALIEDDAESGRARAHIALFTAQQGDIEGARAYAASINFPPWRSWAEEKLATARSDAPPVTRLHVQSTEAQPPKDALAAIRQRAISDARWQRILDAVLPEPPAARPAALLAFWARTWDEEGHHFLDLFSDQPRGRLLDDLRTLVPLIGQYGALNDLAMLDQSLKTVVGWWR